MGGVRSASVVVECDRCKKEVMVTDEDQAKHYREFAKREDQDDRMFVAILNPPAGESTDVDFEYVCPKCSEAIVTYIDKILMKKAPPKNNDGGDEDKGDDEKKNEGAKKKRKSKAKETENNKEGENGKTEEPADSPPPEEEPEAPPPEETQAGSDFEDDELFD